MSAILAENDHTSQLHACCHCSDTGWIGAVRQSWVPLASNWPRQHPTMPASALSSCPTLECVACPHLGGPCHCRLGGSCPYRMVGPCRVRPRTALAGPTPRQGCHCVRPARLRRRRTPRPGARAAARFRQNPAPPSWRHRTRSVHFRWQRWCPVRPGRPCRQCVWATGAQAAALMWRNRSLAAWRGATPPQITCRQQSGHQAPRNAVRSQDESSGQHALRQGATPPQSSSTAVIKRYIERYRMLGKAGQGPHNSNAGRGSEGYTGSYVASSRLGSAPKSSSVPSGRTCTQPTALHTSEAEAGLHV